MAGRHLCGQAIAAALVLAGGGANACERPEEWSGARKIAGNIWTAWWQPAPAPVPVGIHFSVRFRLCGPPVRRVGVRGWMPDHRHGMNYRPAVTLNSLSGNGLSGAAEGLLFHMPGRWQIVLEVAGAAGKEKLVAETVLQ